MRKISTAILLLIAFIGCAKLDKLSEDVSIRSFNITSSSPEQIVLGDVRIDADTVYIPIEYGKYLFPLTVTANINTAIGNERLAGIASGTPFIINSIDQIVEFVVTTESGYSKSYFIKPEEKALDEDADIHAPVSIVEPDSVYDRLVTQDSDHLNFIAFDAEYPITITPTFTIGELSKVEAYSSMPNQWGKFENGATPLTFEDESTQYKFEVEAASGKIKEWTIGLKQIAVNPVQPSTQIDFANISVAINNDGATHHRTDVDIDAGIVTFLVDTSAIVTKPYFPINLDVTVPKSEWNDLSGMDETFSHGFTSWSDTVSYITFDAEGMMAARWKFTIAPQGVERIYTVEDFSVTNLTTGRHDSKDNLTISTLQPTINSEAKEITIFYSSIYKPGLFMFDNWSASFECAITPSQGATISASTFTWEVKKAGFLGTVTPERINTEIATTKPFTLTMPDGQTQEWRVKLSAEDLTSSAQSKIEGLTITSTYPNYTTFTDPAYLILTEGDEQIIQFNIGDRYNFPMTINTKFQLSSNASVDNSGAIVFEDKNSVVPITVTSHDGSASTTYSARLNIPEVVAASDILSVTTQTPEGITLHETEINTEQSTIYIGVEASDADFPISIPVSDYTLSEGATLTRALEAITFDSANGTYSVIVQSPTQERRIWYFKIKYYEQIAGSDLDSWSGMYINEPWSTSNMEVAVTVKNTTAVAGISGQAGDYAAEMKTGETFGNLASGALFTGHLDTSKALSHGTSDPTILTWFGVPFSPDVEIKGISFDISYSTPNADTDWGSAAVTLINWDGNGVYEFHGMRPKSTSPKDPTKGTEPHPNNTATTAARASFIIGNTTGTTTYGDDITLTLPKGEWSREVFLPIDGSVEYTHIAITFASSAYGDFFKGVVGSTMRVDNIKIVY